MVEAEDSAGEVGLEGSGECRRWSRPSACRGGRWKGWCDERREGVVVKMHSENQKQTKGMFVRNRVSRREERGRHKWSGSETRKRMPALFLSLS